MDQELVSIEHLVTDENVETACEIGVGPGWRKMGDVEKNIYRGYFRKFLTVHGVIHRKLATSQVKNLNSVSPKAGS